MHGGRVVAAAETFALVERVGGRHRRLVERHAQPGCLGDCQIAVDDAVRRAVVGRDDHVDRAGLVGAFAAPGTYVPGIDVTLSVGKIRGVESHGMMASERELELSDEHEGIIELPSGEVGEKFTDWLAAHAPEKIDPVIHVKITPNRPDALGVHGIARDLSARGLGLKAGQVVTTGSAANVIKVNPGDAVVADFGILGAAQVNFI